MVSIVCAVIRENDQQRRLVQHPTDAVVRPFLQTGAIASSTSLHYIGNSPVRLPSNLPWRSLLPTTMVMAMLMAPPPAAATSRQSDFYPPNPGLGTAKTRRSLSRQTSAAMRQTALAMAHWQLQTTEAYIILKGRGGVLPRYGIAQPTVVVGRLRHQADNVHA